MKKSRIAYVCAAAVLLAAAVFSGCENAAGGSDTGGTEENNTGGTGGGGSIENIPEVDTDPDAAAKLTGSWYREGTEPSLILKENSTGIDHGFPMTWTASETELQTTKTEDITPGEVTWQCKKESDSSLILEGSTFTYDENDDTWSGTMSGAPATLTMTDTTFRLDMPDGKSGQMVTGTVDINTYKLTLNRTINIMTYSYQLSADGNTLTLDDGRNDPETYNRQPQA